ncbi:MAG: flagellar biosynthesis protein FlhB [Magnetococcales bacterium]|nr:flagellar biosynthesis protein FlhB [Magnetococcales bacterium]
MAEDTDQESKTEQPSSKRLQDARNKGQVPNSREVPTALLFLASLPLFFFQGPKLWGQLQGEMRFLLGEAISHDLTPVGVATMVRDILTLMLLDLAPFFGVFLVVGLLASLVQHGWLFTLEPLAPNFSKISPLKGFKRLFSSRSLMEMVKSVLKMTVVGVAVYLGVRNHVNTVVGLSATSVGSVLMVLTSVVFEILWRVALAFLVLAILDFSYQKFEHLKGLRMTKQEVKDELKQTEGDPLLKGRIRQIQREMAQRRMMQEVPKADVVITNPTHYSVALRYVPGEMQAPRVVAKGVDAVAARIREVAKEHKVPLVENPPLARTLFRDVDLEQSIPPDLFKAVAEVLAYVFSLKKARGR